VVFKKTTAGQWTILGNGPLRPRGERSDLRRCPASMPCRAAVPASHRNCSNHKTRGADRGYLARQGYIARGGQILDASIVPVPRNHNTRDENAAIKKGEAPEDWADKPAKRVQKDMDARWTKKHGKSHYGYKNHVNVDRTHKLVRRYHVSPSRDIAAQCPVPLPGSTCEACVRGGNGRRCAPISSLQAATAGQWTARRWTTC